MAAAYFELAYLLAASCGTYLFLYTESCVAFTEPDELEEIAFFASMFALWTFRISAAACCRCDASPSRSAFAFARDASASALLARALLRCDVVCDDCSSFQRASAALVAEARCLRCSKAYLWNGGAG